MFLPSLASVMAARPCFCSFLLFVVEVPANFVETAKRAITHRIRIFDKVSEHVKVAKSVDIAVPELAVTYFSFKFLVGAFSFKARLLR